METISVVALQGCLEVLAGVPCSIRRVDIATSEEVTVTFRRDCENNWYLDCLEAH